MRFEGSAAANTSPSLARSPSTGTPSFVEARPRSAARPSAAARRNADPPSMMPFELPVPRWSTVAAVSPMTIVTRSIATSSSSATSCAKAVPMPMPASILPTDAVTLP
jgi:hypothetical protein